MVSNSVQNLSEIEQSAAEFGHMTPEVPQKFKVKVTARRNMGTNLPNHYSAEDCSISIIFTTDYDHVTSNLPQTFKVNGLNVKVIA